MEKAVCPTCRSARRPDELYDFTGLPVVVRATLHLDAAWLCSSCFQTAVAHGRLLASAIAAACGMDAATVAAMQSGERGRLIAGELLHSPVNHHLSGP